MAWNLARCIRAASMQHPHVLFLGVRSYGYTSYKVEEAYTVLGVSKDASDADVRAAYVKLAKEFHPDANSGDREKFMEVSDAYKRVTESKSQEEQLKEFLDWLDAQLQEVEDRQKYRHKAPQHRQYLEYPSGPGTVSQRQRQAVTMKAEQAYANVSEKRFDKLRGDVSANSVDLQTRAAARRARITNAIDRVVEDLIQEAMSKGDFDNLPGKGKPLPERQYHYVSHTEAKLNEFIINSGCLPPWIELEKEIRDRTKLQREKLAEAWQRCGPEPMPAFQRLVWQETVDKFRESVIDINKKVRDFNLIVPIVSRQRCFVDAEKELSRIKQCHTTSNGQKPYQVSAGSDGCAGQEPPPESPVRRRLRTAWQAILYGKDGA